MLDVDVQLNSKKSLIEGYFAIHQHYESLYGENTIVLIELGSFFEVYGVENKEVTVGKAREIADILNIQLTRKNKNIAENSLSNPLMAGFPTATFDRYITRLIQEKKYTIVIIRQKGMPPNVTRFVDQIISPGVNIDYCLNHDDNYIASVVVEKNQDIYAVGYATIDLSTGKTYVFEGYGSKEDPTAALDNLFKLLQTYAIAELIFVPGDSTIHESYLLHYLELSEHSCIQPRKKRLPISYQNELFKHAYTIQSFLSPIEYLDLEKQPLTSEALAHLLEFVIDHDGRVVENLKKPTILDTDTFLYLGNNALEQLNILSKDSKELTVLSLFDHTATAIGKRLFRDRLTNPITNKAEITARYDLSDAVSPQADELRIELRKIYDLERIVRRIKLGRLHPYEINYLYDSLMGAQSVQDKITDDRVETLLPDFMQASPILHDYRTYIEQTFNLDETTKVTNQTIRTSLFQPGFNTQLDELLAQKHTLENKISAIQTKFIELIEHETGKEDPGSVTIKRRDKEGHHISITKGRFAIIEPKIRDTFLSIDGTVHAFSDFSYKQLTTHVKITAEVLGDISKEINQVEMRIVAAVKDMYADELKRLDAKFSDFLDICTQALAKLDCALSNALSAQKLRLVRPEIIDAPENESYISIDALRHPLVESQEERGIYIPNHVVLGSSDYFTEQDKKSVIAQETNGDIGGLLLYGINSSGKSSLMKSLGIAIVLAQSGNYVPASTMRFSLCTELFTRIVSTDNFERGLSSFAVEMMELKNIFNRCSAKSLILGDEISHGTETLSAIAIVSATMKRLAEQKALFLFTTHLHQIYELALMKSLKNIASVHMAIHYDKESDRLIFDRKLQPGNGSSIYGLEFAESLHMDPAFLRYATDIRKSLANDYSTLEKVAKKQKSKYNKDVYLSSCAICKDSVDDTHHIAPQEAADASGNIGHFHKNHQYNLLPICKKCHTAIHQQKIHIKGFMMTDQGLELMYEKRKKT